MEVGDQLKRSMKNIELSDAAELRILENCALAAKQKGKKRLPLVSNRHFRKTAAAVTAAVLCLCLSATAVAAGNTGHFRDVKNWFGAVTGTKYEQADGEIQISATAASGQLTVSVTLLTPNALPYRMMEMLGIERYQIVDKRGKVVQKGSTSEFFQLKGAGAEITLPLDDLKPGEYEVRIHAFLGGAKGEQPLPISGEWKCGFVI